MNNDKMIGSKSTIRGCAHGKTCICNGYYRSKRMSRQYKRSERQQWKRDL